MNNGGFRWHINKEMRKMEWRNAVVYVYQHFNEYNPISLDMLYFFSIIPWLVWDFFLTGERDKVFKGVMTSQIGNLHSLEVFYITLILQIEFMIGGILQRRLVNVIEICNFQIKPNGLDMSNAEWFHQTD